MRLAAFNVLPLVMLVALTHATFESTVLGGEYSAPRGGGHGAGFKLSPAEKLQWKAGPPSLPPGAQIAVLEGDPGRDGPFVFRVKVPDGYRIPPHTHPKTERVTVISGTFHLGMGDRFDPHAVTALPAGTYGYWEAGMKHFVWVKGETIVQFHGTGPWSIEYLDPKDDPRNRAEK